MTTLKASAVLAWILALAITASPVGAAPPAGAAAQDGATEAWARAFVQSTTTEWSEAFVARGGSYRPPRLVFTRLPRQHPARGAGYAPGEIVALDLGELEEVRSIFRQDGDALVALMIAHEVAHHAQFLDVRAGRYVRPADPDYELQADCAAGWWLARANARHQASQGGPLFVTPDLGRQLPRLFQTLYTLQHRRLSPPSPAATRLHGADARRIAAFRHGLGGASACLATAPG